MAYSGNENISLVLRTVKHTFDFTGRARRTEIVYFGIASGILSAVLSMVLLGHSFVIDTILMAVIPLIVGIPSIALFVRRLHDEGRSGWWALLFIPAIALSLWQHWRFATAPFEELSKSDPLDWIGIPLGLTLLILAFLPPQDGANRFGDDPRVE